MQVEKLPEAGLWVCPAPQFKADVCHHVGQPLWSKRIFMDGYWYRGRSLFLRLLTAFLDADGTNLHVEIFLQSYFQKAGVLNYNGDKNPLMGGGSELHLKNTFRGDKGARESLWEGGVVGQAGRTSAEHSKQGSWQVGQPYT